MAFFFLTFHTNPHFLHQVSALTRHGVARRVENISGRPEEFFFADLEPRMSERLSFQPMVVA
jgi:hypothetical protein